VKSDDIKATETLNIFYQIAPDNIAIYSALTDVYFSADKKNILVDFYKSQELKYKSDSKVLGNIYFYLAQIYLNTDNKTARKYLLQAKKQFSKILKKDHQVFKAIDSGLEITKKKN